VDSWTVDSRSDVRSGQRFFSWPGDIAVCSTLDFGGVVASRIGFGESVRPKIFKAL